MGKPGPFHDRLQARSRLHCGGHGRPRADWPARPDRPVRRVFLTTASPSSVVYALSAEWRRSLPLEYLRSAGRSASMACPSPSTGGSHGLRLWERQLSLFWLRMTDGPLLRDPAGIVRKLGDVCRRRAIDRANTFARSRLALEHVHRHFPGRYRKEFWVYAHSYVWPCRRASKKLGQTLRARPRSQRIPRRGRLAPRLSVARRGNRRSGERAACEPWARSARTKTRS